MKDTLIEGCIGYLKFGYDFDGMDFPENSEAGFREVLSGETDPASLINRYIEENSLATEYDAGHDELGRYPGTRCIVNYFNIKDRQKLKRVERMIGSRAPTILRTQYHTTTITASKNTTDKSPIWSCKSYRGFSTSFLGAVTKTDQRLVLFIVLKDSTLA